MIDEHRLETLINAYFDRTLEPGDKVELESMLMASARCREIFHEHAQWHGLTREWALRSQVTQFREVGAAGTAAPSRKVIHFPYRRLSVLGWAAAAAIAISWIVAQLLSPSFQPLPDDSESLVVETGISEIRELREVAMLADAVEVEWAEDSIVPSVGSAIPKGWLKIKRGMLRLDFYSGVHAIIEGPASIELLSTESARLEQGKLTARVTAPAIGFTVYNDAVKVIDRGTEFGMNASGPGQCEVHVFEGEVALLGEAIKTGEKVLFGGDGIAINKQEWSPIRSDRKSFLDPIVLREAVQRLTNLEWNAWKQKSSRFRAAQEMKAYFDFQNLDSYSQNLPNLAKGATPGNGGTIIGCETCPGRWPQKQALGFAKTSDRVRFRMDGISKDVTMMAWVRVDSLPQDHNVLLAMSPPGSKGELHWKLDKTGHLVIGVRTEDRLGYDAWSRLVSPQIIGENEFGHWVHLATVIDGDRRTMAHYLNGREISRGTFDQSTDISFGVATIGNSSTAAEGYSRPKNPHEIRNFSGRIDEFALLARALSPDEIAAAAR